MMSNESGYANMGDTRMDPVGTLFKLSEQNNSKRMTTYTISKICVAFF